MFPGARWIEVRPPSGQTSIVISDADTFGQEPGQGAFLTFECDDIQTTVDELRAAGAEVTDPLEEPWRTHAMVRDPDGHEVQIAEK